MIFKNGKEELDHFRKKNSNLFSMDFTLEYICSAYIHGARLACSQMDC